MGMMHRLAMWATRHIFVPAAIAVQVTPQLPASPRSPASMGTGRKRTSPKPVSITRWVQRDVESAQRQASNGDLTLVGRLYRSLARDGMLLGLLGTRSGGLVRLPKRFSGSPAGIAYLQGEGGKKGAFSKHFPTSELSKLARDGFAIGVGVGEFIELHGCRVLVRLDPEFLRYRWYEDQWYYASADGMVPITPGDGRWVLYTPGGLQEPWDQGTWAALSRGFISKEHALLSRENWNGTLAHPARVAVSPQGAGEKQKQSWFRAVMAWGVNTVFGLTPGYDVRLLESNGRGYESFRETISDANQEFMVVVAGQVVTVTGGAGFANADIHATIRGDLIEGDGMALAECLCEQALPHVLDGIVPCGERTDFVWDTRPPTSRKDEADALKSAAEAIGALVVQLTPHGMKVDVNELAVRFGVPIVDVTAVLERMIGDSANGNAIDVEDDEHDCDHDEPCESELADEDIVSLATKMSLYGIERCEHGHSNRCWKCGIERVRDFEQTADGETVWSVSWRPIRTPAGVAA